MRFDKRKFLIVAFLLFAVLSVSAAAQDPGLSLEKAVFAPGEQIRVSFSAPSSYASNAWVGVIPSGVPHGDEKVNDRYDISYQYLEKRVEGVLTFNAPSSPGSYDLRMHDTDDGGREVASVSFTVRGDGSSITPSLCLDRNLFGPGEEITVSFTAPSNYASNAWVGIIPSGVPHGDEKVNDKYDISYQYLDKHTGGILVFTAPSEEGSFDLRMHDTDNNGKEVASVSFTVSRVSTGKP
jgi:fatty acid-binding protein DegV